MNGQGCHAILKRYQLQKYTGIQVGGCILSLEKLADSNFSGFACEFLHSIGNRTASFNLRISSLCAEFNAMQSLPSAHLGMQLSRQPWLIAGSLGLRDLTEPSTEQSRENQVNPAAQLLTFKLKIPILCYCSNT